MNSNISLTSPIVSVAWLHEHINANNLVILDGTINKVFDNTTQQIPNARLFEIKKKFSDLRNPFPSAFPPTAQFQKEARALGINQDSAIVVYDDKGIYSSARVWWLFKAFGYNNVAVLNGGFPEWQKARYLTESMHEYQGESGNFIANLQPNYMRFFNDIEKASKNNTHKIIDARSSGRFNCIEPEPRAGLRMGTIPNSINLPFTDLLDNGVLKSKKDLAKAFYMVAEQDEPIIFSCGSGITACVLALGAELSGYKNISVYDGSWTEYGSLVTSDMEKPSTWTKEELLAYILMYVSHADLGESRKEKDYILSRVDKAIYNRVNQQFEKDNDYQSIQNIIEAVKSHNYYRNDLADLFADIKLMAFVDGDYDPMEQMIYSHLKKMLKEN
ncbi:sulfurtransferase [uncultured Algibacter sp.]|uniref:sulfurtransferase n=1 Tax=uncultured Algibacter sp. TaxID=298659 RepID=UPI00263753C1|nr:sulfurtransferase [uncultured Algibacter sp.]